MIIEGSGHKPVKMLVTSEGRAATEAVTRSRLEFIAQNEAGSYFLATNFIDLTDTANFSGIFYIKNISSNTDIHIYKLRTCGVVPTQWIMTRNPSTGTLISGAIPGIASNLNVGSSKTFDSTVYAGVNGATITDGTHFTQWINGPGHSEQELEGAIVVPNGSAFALSCKPIAATPVCVSMLVYQHDLTNTDL